MASDFDHAAEKNAAAYLQKLYGWKLQPDWGSFEIEESYCAHLNIPSQQEFVDARLTVLINLELVPEPLPQEIRKQVTGRIKREIARYRDRPSGDRGPLPYEPVRVGSKQVTDSIIDWEVNYWLTETLHGEWIFKIEGEDGYEEEWRPMGAKELLQELNKRDIDHEEFHKQFSSAPAWKRFMDLTAEVRNPRIMSTLPGTKRRTSKRWC